ncbi:MAG: DUF2085 domain-containing protein [Thermomicrobiales bacterium]|nr:DUF2085 domain-containing protein [Thermomicrobiales bacterium]
MAALRQYWLWPAAVLLGMAVLLLMPGGLATNSRLLLHGLCAQTPSHTFVIGGQLLPFDARMTGVYAGAGVTILYLATRGRLLSDALPSWPIRVVLGGMLAAMALDGSNSFLTDVGVWHPWETTNLMRLITGYGAGVTIAVALVWLLGGTVYQIADRTPSIRGWSDLAIILTGLPLLGLALRLSLDWMYLPLTLFLTFSAWMVVSTLVLVTGMLLFRIDDRIVHRPQLHAPGAFAAILGLVVIILLASGRRWLETTMGIPSNL